jgi:hypothetical protein
MPDIGRLRPEGIALLSSAIALSACMSWRAPPSDPAALLATRKPALVRVIRTDSSRVMLRNPTLQHDSLFGTEVSDPDNTEGRNQRAIPLADGAAVQTRQPDATKNVLLGAGILVGTLGAMCLLADELGCDAGFDTADGLVK